MKVSKKQLQWLKARPMKTDRAGRWYFVDSGRVVTTECGTWHKVYAERNSMMKKRGM